MKEREEPVTMAPAYKHLRWHGSRARLSLFLMLPLQQVKCNILFFRLTLMLKNDLPVNLVGCVNAKSTFKRSWKRRLFALGTFLLLYFFLDIVLQALYVDLLLAVVEIAIYLLNLGIANHSFIQTRTPIPYCYTRNVQHTIIRVYHYILNIVVR